MSYKARRYNRELTIPEEKAEEYAQMGYSVTDANGNVVVEAVITSVADAKKEMEVLRMQKMLISRSNSFRKKMLN